MGHQSCCPGGARVGKKRTVAGPTSGISAVSGLKESCRGGLDVLLVQVSQTSDSQSCGAESQPYRRDCSVAGTQQLASYGIFIVVDRG